MVSFSRVTTSYEVRSSPTTRATTRWKLFVPMSSAASTAASDPTTASVTRWSEPAAARTMASADSVLAGGQSTQHPCPERIDLLEGGAVEVRVGGLVAQEHRGADGLVQVSRRQQDLLVRVVGHEIPLLVDHQITELVDRGN